MTQQTKTSAQPVVSPSSHTGPLRCLYCTPTGRQCRAYRTDPNSNLCARHARIDKGENADNINELLTIAREQFLSAEKITHSLAELFALLAENRVSPRRAAVLAYIGSLILRTLPMVARERAGETEEAGTTIIWDLPGPRPTPTCPNGTREEHQNPQQPPQQHEKPDDDSAG